MTLQQRDLTITSSDVANLNECVSDFLAHSDAMAPPNSDLSFVARAYAAGATVHHPMAELPEGPFKGMTSIQGFFEDLGKRFSAVQLVENNRILSSDSAILELTIKAVLAQNGKRVELPAVFALTFNAEGLVFRQRTYIRPEDAV